jgi:hypothetical protein
MLSPVSVKASVQERRRVLRRRDVELCGRSAVTGRIQNQQGDFAAVNHAVADGEAASVIMWQGVGTAAVGPECSHSPVQASAEVWAPAAVETNRNSRQRKAAERAVRIKSGFDLAPSLDPINEAWTPLLVQQYINRLVATDVGMHQQSRVAVDNRHYTHNPNFL